MSKRRSEKRNKNGFISEAGGGVGACCRGEINGGRVAVVNLEGWDAALIRAPVPRHSVARAGIVASIHRAGGDVVAGCDHPGSSWEEGGRGPVSPPGLLKGFCCGRQGAPFSFTASVSSGRHAGVQVMRWAT